MFKLTLLLLALVASVFAGGNPLQKLCDPSDPDFQAQHSAAWGQIAVNSDQGWLWHQETVIVAPVPTDNGVMLMEVQRYTWYHHVEWSDEQCGYVNIQVWPKYSYDPVTYQPTFLGWGVQEIAIDHKNPAYRQSDAIPPVPELAFTEYTPTWVSPYLADSVLVMGATSYEAGVGPDSLLHSWHSPVTGKVVFSGKIVNFVPGVYRTYTYAIPIQTVPDVDESIIDVLTSIYSRAAPAPQVITDAINWYNSVKDLEDPPLTQDPADPTGGQLPPVFIYFPPAEKAVEGDNAIPENTHGAQLPIIDAITYNRAVEFLINSQE